MTDYFIYVDNNVTEENWDLRLHILSKINTLLNVKIQKKQWCSCSL